jgi:hypothetical protein
LIFVVLCATWVRVCVCMPTRRREVTGQQHDDTHFGGGGNEKIKCLRYGFAGGKRHT